MRGYYRNPDDELRDAERKAKADGVSEDVERYAFLLRRVGEELCNCESQEHTHDYPCLNQANHLTLTPVGKICNECAENIPLDLHIYSGYMKERCWCKLCINAYIRPEALGSMMLQLLQEKNIFCRELQNGEHVRTWIHSSQEQREEFPFAWFSLRCFHRECNHLRGFGPLRHWGESSPCIFSPPTSSSGVWQPIVELQYLLMMNYAELVENDECYVIPTEKLINLEGNVFD